MANKANQLGHNTRWHSRCGVMFSEARENMNVGSKVKLKTFNGRFAAPGKCDPSENYWLLIGTTGTISKSENIRGRVLVMFDIDPIGLGLYCHNEVPNSLLILPSDLEVL